MAITKLRPAFTFDHERIGALNAIAPEAFADGKINWDVLHEALGDYLEDERRDAEHFGLFWPGKREARRLATLPSVGGLRPAPGEGINEESTRNVFIEGDNLEVLKLLQKSYAGQVKVIYIDPPYNTGHDFIYQDNFHQPLEEYLRLSGQTDEAGKATVTNTQAGGRYHSNWLNMMYPRLRLARNLLGPGGAIFVSIDDHEVHNLRALMNETFGDENYIATIIWQKNFSPKNSARHFSEDHDYIVVYAQSSAEWMPQTLPRTEEADARYSNPDSDPRGPWTSSDLSARNYYGEGKYEVINSKGTRFAPPRGRYWTINAERFAALDHDNRIWWGADGENMPRLKRFLTEVKQGMVPQTLWKHEDVGHTQEAKKELLTFVTFEDTDNVLDTVKPIRLLRRILQIATSPLTEDIVLDFFAGSAPTAHAVLMLNHEDNGNRRFVTVQLPERLPAPEKLLSTISDIGRQRIISVIRSMQAQDAGKWTTGRDTAEDLGFKVFKLDRSNYKGWRDFDAGDVAELQTLFDRFETPLVDGWTPEDVLVEIMLMEGFPLDGTVAERPEFRRNRVQQVSSDMLAHKLYVCLDAHVYDETIAGLTMAEDDIFICLDSALSDEAKVQLEDGRRVKVI
jgi:adenine-specific DNA-methyltransferase